MMRKNLSLIIIFLLVFIRAAWADTIYYPTGFIEAGGNYSDLTNGYSNWYGEYLNLAVQTSQANIWGGELRNQFEFDDKDSYGSIRNTHNFDENWYSYTAFGYSAHGFFWPQYDGHASLYRKLLRDKSLIAGIGYNFYNYTTGNSTNALLLESMYYYKSWLINAGIYFNQSQPGSIYSTSQFVALTQGQDKYYYLTLRYDFGRVTYQPVSPTVVLVDFPANTLSLTWRQWINKSWGFSICGDYFASSPYNRYGGSFGIFKEL